MHKRIPFRSLLTLSSLAIGACGDSDPAPYAPDDSYQSAAQSPGGGYGYGGSAWVGDVVSSADAGSGAGSGDAAASTPSAAPDVELRSGVFQNYLVDARGKPLYMFANDVVGSNASACNAACLGKWPAFDAKDIEVGAGLDGADFSRFQHADGAWQTTFKGHPLYYYASDPAAGAVTGDGSGGRWFVARDYFAFVGAKAELTPLGASAPAPFMTNRAGRTIYVFMMDSAGSGSSAPLSACNGPCLDNWPTWNAPPSLDDLVLPSNMEASDFAVFERDVGGAVVRQLTYRGWPLYFYAQDDAAGETAGHQSAGMWRAFEPGSFADRTGPRSR